MKNSLLSWSYFILHICFVGTLTATADPGWVANPYAVVGGAGSDYLLLGESVSPADLVPDWDAPLGRRKKKQDIHPDRLLDQVAGGDIAAVRAALLVPGFDVNHEYRKPKPARAPIMERLGLVSPKEGLEASRHQEDLEGDHGMTLLHMAVIKDQLEIATLLADNAANIDALAAYNQTPLHGAARAGHVRMIDFLITRGADKEAKNGHSFTPLVRAIFYNKLDAIRALIRHSVITDEAFDWRGIKPVAIAAEWDRVEAIGVLLGCAITKLPAAVE